MPKRLLNGIFIDNISPRARNIFHSSLASPNGGWQICVFRTLPSRFIYVESFSVYAGEGKITSALWAPLSPWWPI